MKTIEDALDELEIQQEDNKRLDYVIGFTNPEGNYYDETDVEIDSNEDYKNDVLDFFKDFCKDNNWDYKDINIESIYTTNPE